MMSDDVRGSPINVTSAVFRAVENREWTRVPELVDADSLTSFRLRQLSMLLNLPDDLLETSGNEVPAGVVELFNAAKDPSRFGFARVTSIADLKALPSHELFARYLEGHAPNPQSYADGRGPITRRHIIGEVRETDTLAHVVYRIITDVGVYGITEEIELLRSSKRGEQWAVHLNRDLDPTGFAPIVKF